MPHTILHIIENRATTMPEKIVFRFLRMENAEPEVLTFKELWLRSHDIAALLRHTGVSAGDRVILIFPPGLQFPIAFLGAMLADAIPVPIYPPRGRKDGCGPMLRIASDSGATVALTTTEFRDKLEPILEDVASLRLISCDDIDASSCQFNSDRTPDIAYLQYTSGSTGIPKGVVVTHSNLLANLSVISPSFACSENTVGVSWLPPYHDMGLVGSLLTTIYAGGSCVLMPPMQFMQKPLRWLKTISDYQATASGGPNFAYDLCIDKITEEQRDSLDLRSWKVAFNGAERVRRSTLVRFAERFGPAGFDAKSFFSCYGLAEATLMVSGGYGIRGAADDDVVGCGVAADVRGELRIVSLETGLPVSEGESGELCVSNDSITAGYWNRPKETDETFYQHNGGPRFLRTGDIATILNGELFITGRTKELVIIRGRNYCPDDIEDVVEGSHLALASHACAVFACDGGAGESLVIVQEVRRDHVTKLSVDEVMDAIRRAVVEQFELRPHAIVLVRPASLPKTLNGKIMRIACREAFEGGRLNVVAQWTAATIESQPVNLNLPATVAGSSEDKIQAWLIDRLAHELGIPLSDIDPVKPLANYALDSLHQASLIGEISEYFGHTFSPQLFNEYQDIQSLAAYLSVIYDVEARLQDFQPDQRRSMLLALAETKDARIFASTDEIPERCYSFEAFPEVQELAARAGKLLSSEIPNPFFKVSSRVAGARTLIDGVEFINYSSNNYLGLSEHPEVIAAAKEALDQYGTSVSASRIVSGERSVHQDLERALADFVGADDCLTFVGGNTANVTTIGHLFSERDLVLYDERSHDSVLKGIKLAQADSYPFRHNSWEDAERLLASKRTLYQKVLVFIEGIYSMDGDIPDLPRFIELKKRHKAMLMVDECLSIGVLGKHGRGIAEQFGIESTEVDIWMGSISKALASCGGYIAGSRALVNYLRYTAPGFVFTTGISPTNAAAALAALRVLERESWRVVKLHEMAGTFLNKARQLGFDTGTSSDTPAIPIFFRDPNVCLLLYKHLFEHQINVQPIFYPAVPADASRLRFFVTCSHTEEDIDFALTILAEGKAALDRQASGASA